MFYVSFSRQTCNSTALPSQINALTNNNKYNNIWFYLTMFTSLEIVNEILSKH